MIEKLNYYATCSSEEYSKILEWLNQFNSEQLSEILDTLYKEIFFKKHPDFLPNYQKHLARLRTHLKLCNEVVQLDASIKYKEKSLKYEDIKYIYPYLMEEYHQCKEKDSRFSKERFDYQPIIDARKDALYTKYFSPDEILKIMRAKSAESAGDAPAKPDITNKLFSYDTDIQLLSNLDENSLLDLIHNTLVSFRKGNWQELDCVWMFLMAKLCTSNVNNHGKEERPYSLATKSDSTLLRERKELREKLEDLNQEEEQLKKKRLS